MLDDVVVRNELDQRIGRGLLELILEREFSIEWRVGLSAKMGSDLIGAYLRIKKSRRDNGE